MDEQAIFLGALERDDPAERLAFVLAACAGNEKLRERIDKLLEVYGRVGSFLEVPAAPVIDRTAPIVNTLGDFRLLREIGRGGMGVVYEAEQMSLGRRVALKVLPLAGVLDERQLTRFRNESRAAASLKHPNIVGVHAVGCERGVHYYAMEYVEGKSLAEVIAELRRESEEVTEGGQATTLDAPAQPPAARSAAFSRFFGGSERRSPEGGTTNVPPEEAAPVGQAFQPDVGLERPMYETADTDRQGRAQASTQKPTGTKEFFRRVANWGIQAAQGLEHAHQTGIVHRDVKPSNLLVDAAGHLWITDFGLVQVLAPSSLGGEGRGVGPALTMTGDILGTLRYMSPEQAAGRSRVLDHHTDIYSLGVTLYELLALRPPFSGDDRQEILRQIIDEDPAPPRHCNRVVPKDLETIVLKAMAKEPSARYATAQEMAEDLKRFLADEPIRARPPTLVQRAAKWARRHRPLVRAAVAMLLMAVVLLSGAVVWVISARKETERQRDEAIGQQRIAQGLRLEAEQREQVLREQLYAADVKTAHESWRQARLEWIENFFRHTDPDLRGFEWFYLYSLCHQDQRTLRGHQGEVCCVVYDRQGRHLASAAEDGTVRLWDAATGQLRGVLQVGREGHYHAAAFSPDGATLAATAAGGKVKRFDVATLAEQPPLEPEPSSVHSLAYSPDGRFLATGGTDGTVRLYDVATGKRQQTIPGHDGDITAVAFSPDSRTLASGGADQQTRVWDVASGKRVVELQGHLKTITCQTFSPDGSTLASASVDRRIILWDLATEKERLNLLGHGDRIHCVAYAPDGRTLFSCGKDGTIRVWDTADGKELNVLRGHVGRVRSLAVSPDGRTLASGGADGTVKFWDFSAPQEYQAGPASDQAILAVAFAPDGTLVVCEDTQLAFWGIEAGRETGPRVKFPARIFRPALSPDFRTLVAEDYDTEILGFYSTVTGQRTAELPRPLGLDPRERDTTPLFSRDGRLLVTIWESLIEVRDLTSQAKPRGIRPPDVPYSIAISPDAKTAAVGLGMGGTALLDLASCQWRATLRGGAETESVRCVCFSPDGRVLASSGDDRVIRLWDLASGQLLKSLVGPRAAVVAPAFSPDGRTLASASEEQAVRLWRVASGRELLVLESPSNILALAFSPDGMTLAAGTGVPGRGAVYLWRGRSPPAPDTEEKSEQGAR